MLFARSASQWKSTEVAPCCHANTDGALWSNRTTTNGSKEVALIVTELFASGSIWYPLVGPFFVGVSGEIRECFETMHFEDVDTYNWRPLSLPSL